MGGKKRGSGVNWTIAQWPDVIDPMADIITPYPCCSCKSEFRSTRGLRTHKCTPRSGKVKA